MAIVELQDFRLEDLCVSRLKIPLIGYFQSILKEKAFRLFDHDNCLPTTSEPAPKSLFEVN
jgi:hypothetical protein